MDELLKKTLERFNTAPEQCKLTKTTPISKIKDGEFKAMIDGLYKAKDAYGHKNLNARLWGVLVNAMFTQSRLTFLMSRPIFEELIKGSGTRRAISGDDYSEFINNLLINKFLERVREGKKRQASVYKLASGELRNSFLQKFAKAFFEEQERKCLELFDESAKTSNQKSSESEIGSGSEGESDKKPPNLASLFEDEEKEAGSSNTSTPVDPPQKIMPPTPVTKPTFKDIVAKWRGELGVDVVPAFSGQNREVTIQTIVTTAKDLGLSKEELNVNRLLEHFPTRVAKKRPEWISEIKLCFETIVSQQFSPQFQLSTPVRMKEVELTTPPLPIPDGIDWDTLSPKQRKWLVATLKEDEREHQECLELGAGFKQLK